MFETSLAFPEIGPKGIVGLSDSFTEDSYKLDILTLHEKTEAVWQQKFKTDHKVDIPEGKINWSNLKEEDFASLELAVVNGRAKEICELLPSPIENTKESNFRDFLIFLIKQGFAKDLLEKTAPVKDFAQISENQFYFFYLFIISELTSDLFKFLPDFSTIKLSNFNSSFSLFIEYLVENNAELKDNLKNIVRLLIPERISFIDLSTREANAIALLLKIDPEHQLFLLPRIENQIDVLMLDTFQISLLINMLCRGFGQEIVKLMVSSAKNVSLGYFSIELLSQMSDLGFGQKVLEILENIPNKDSSSAFKVYAALAKNGFAKETIDFGVLQEKLDLETDYEGSKVYLSHLVEAGFGDQVLQKISTYPELFGTFVDYELETLFTKLVKNGFVKQVLALLSEEALNPIYLTSDGLLVNLCLRDDGFKRKFFDNLPTNFGLDFVRNAPLHCLVEAGFGEELINRLVITDDFLNDFEYDYHDRVENQKNFLLFLANSGFKDRFLAIFSKRITELESSLRSPLSGENLILGSKVGPHLHEIIKLFPVDYSSPIDDLRGGWKRADVDKTGSRAKIYAKLSDEYVISVFFRNYQIPIQSLENYLKAFSVMPNFISGPTYPELDDGDTPEFLQAKTYRDGFREVYAGPSLSDIKINLLPEPLKKSILDQRKLIICNLAINGIDHGHPHNRNFNVRFLLEKDGQKQIIFDINLAVQLAFKNKMNITPIVTLRDWDSATSQNQNN